ncbi:MAG: C40 family peptidase [Lachnospiraceae bacterium]
MHPNQVKKGLALMSITGALLIPSARVLAAEIPVGTTELPGAGIESVLKDYQTNTTEEIEKYLVPSEKREYSNLAFANVEETSYLFIRNIPSKEGEWTGKLKRDDAAKIVGPVGEWTKIESGSAFGYVKTEYIITGALAEEKAKALIAQTPGQPEENQFSYAESKEEEQVRLESEAAQKAAQEAEAVSVSAPANVPENTTGGGQAIVDYASQFIGNPYVWGGTSLTGGADCSGFIQSVYANFGVEMPRTSGEMRNAGVEVAYEAAQPGDVICYEGHVGMYIGNNQIVNAIDEAHGIGITNATFTNIITVRRMI